MIISKINYKNDGQQQTNNQSYKADMQKTESKNEVKKLKGKKKQSFE